MDKKKSGQEFLSMENLVEMQNSDVGVWSPQLYFLT